ncbi:hypothetical protein [Pseudodesulfovibrio sp. zrk46]|uniref:hypothetical protein n=1 Tax=Pseudodesulfovibrio sp. zrk46 TaxID=2725288 RepID=UPI001448DD37|nr:hypothetical protein [Pseudodesulfovibrio sp. zrk46]QJB54936.1 hypothetical protein HFN16_00305 [Pseudodesulfovibrio sp. zrk46]
MVGCVPKKAVTSEVSDWNSHTVGPFKFELAKKFEKLGTTPELIRVKQRLNFRVDATVFADSTSPSRVYEGVMVSLGRGGPGLNLRVVRKGSKQWLGDLQYVYRVYIQRSDDPALKGIERLYRSGGYKQKAEKYVVLEFIRGSGSEARKIRYFIDAEEVARELRDNNKLTQYMLGRFNHIFKVI